MVINVYGVAKLLGPSLLAVAVAAAIPFCYALVTDPSSAVSFGLMILLSLVLSQLLNWLGKRRTKDGVSIRELFLFTSSLWLMIALLAAIPIAALLPELNYANAVFESASALSTTGATTISQLETKPSALLLWRSILQMLGGIGFVVIAVAVLPQAATGGMNIFRTESTSFEDSNKFTPHLKTMSVAILSYYIAVFILCIAAYSLGGMGLFMAINAAMCTVATGGMMPIDASMNGFSPLVHYSAAFFMFICSCPFAVVVAGIAGNLHKTWLDQQMRGYLIFTLLTTVAVTATLVCYNGYGLEHAWRVALFNVTSILSTSGFALEDFTQWNPVATLIFFFILPFGGCSGSTSGGIKFFRLQVAASLFKTQLIKSLHPHRVIEPYFNRHVVDAATMHSIITYFAAYIIVTVISSIVCTMCGLNIFDAISATITCLSNVGPAFGPELNPSANFAGLHWGVQLIFAFDMLLGRLEIIPVLLLMTRFFWRA